VGLGLLFLPRCTHPANNDNDKNYDKPTDAANESPENGDWEASIRNILALGRSTEELRIDLQFEKGRGEGACVPCSINPTEPTVE
jgi:hypothetical protein